LYWILVILGFLAMRYNEKNGHWPWRRADGKGTAVTNSETSNQQQGALESERPIETEASETTPGTTAAREVKREIS
jgi:high-affinity iron transporter